MNTIHDLITLEHNTPLATSYVIAEALGIKHRNMFELIKDHQERIEKHFGLIRFETGEIDGKGRPEKYAKLTENQAHYILTLSRNTEEAMEVKALFVKAFSEAREHIQRLEQVIALHDAYAPKMVPLDAFSDLSRYLDLLYESIKAQKKLPGANKTQLTQSLKYVEECMKYVGAHEDTLVDFTVELIELLQAKGDAGHNTNAPDS